MTDAAESARPQTGCMHDQSRRGHQSLRRHRQATPALITTCCHQRQPLLADPVCAGIVLDALHWMDQHRLLILHAAVVMPDHLHFVADPLDVPWPDLLGSLKGFSARRINRRLDRSGTVWQAQYHDRHIGSDRDLAVAVDYCLGNPVRAGLVVSAMDYPHVWSRYG